MSHISNLASKGPDDEPQKVKAAVFSNIALCHLKLKNNYEVKKAVSEKSMTIGMAYVQFELFSSVTPFWKSIQRMLKHIIVEAPAISNPVIPNRRWKILQRFETTQSTFPIHQ